MFNIDDLKRNSPLKYLYFKLFNPRLKFSIEDKEPYIVYLKKNPAFKDYIASEFEEPINQQLNKYGDMEELEYLLEFHKKCFIEPRYGWLVSNRNIVFSRSLPYGISEITPLPHYIYYKRKNKINLKAGLPLFYNWFNYWHFYNDVIGSLMVLDRNGFDKTIPVIVPEKALSVKYVQDFFKTEYSRKWNWLFVDDSTYIHLDCAYIVKSFANVKDQFLLAKEIFKTPETDIVKKKIFLNRDNNKGRNIINIDELLPVIHSFGYEIVDTDDMTIYEQKAIFESAQSILGIHGAGLTNMFFRYPGKCTVLELFPKNHYPIHYYWLAKELGFEYDALSGEDNERGSFNLNKEKLTQFLIKNLQKE